MKNQQKSMNIVHIDCGKVSIDIFTNLEIKITLPKI